MSLKPTTESMKGLLVNQLDNPVKIIGKRADNYRIADAMKNFKFNKNRSSNNPAIFIVSNTGAMLAILAKLGLPPSSDKLAFLILCNGLIMSIRDGVVPDMTRAADQLKFFVAAARSATTLSCEFHFGSTAQSFVLCAEDGCGAIMCPDCLKESTTKANIGEWKCLACLPKTPSSSLKKGPSQLSATADEFVPASMANASESYNKFEFIESLIRSGTAGGSCCDPEAYHLRIDEDDELCDAIIHNLGVRNQTDEEYKKQVQLETFAANRIGGCNYETAIQPWLQNFLSAGGEKITLSWRRMWAFQDLVNESDVSGNADFALVNGKVKCVSEKHNAFTAKLKSMSGVAPGRIALVARLHKLDEDIKTCAMALQVGLWDGVKGLTVFSLPRLNGLHASCLLEADALTARSGAFWSKERHLKEKADAAASTFLPFLTKHCNGINVDCCMVMLMLDDSPNIKFLLNKSDDAESPDFKWVTSPDDMFLSFFDSNKARDGAIVVYGDGQVLQINWKFDFPSREFKLKNMNLL